MRPGNYFFQNFLALRAGSYLFQFPNLNAGILVFQNFPRFARGSWFFHHITSISPKNFPRFARGLIFSEFTLFLARGDLFFPKIFARFARGLIFSRFQILIFCSRGLIFFDFRSLILLAGSYLFLAHMLIVPRDKPRGFYS